MVADPAGTASIAVLTEAPVPSPAESQAVCTDVAHPA